ncbi:MAG: N-6 DNA methylase, partial [Treponema sp.]|nr:N-6 DNA methylase [Treponema sp.]
MRKNRFSGINFDTLKLEGALFTAGMVQKIVSGEANNQTAEDYNILPGLNLIDEIGRSFRIASALWAAYKTGRTTAQKFTAGFFHDCLSYSKEDYEATVNAAQDESGLHSQTFWAIKTAAANDTYAIRLLRPHASLGRPAFVEFNLETILSENRFPDFKMLYLFFHSSRIRLAEGECVWDVWKKEGEDNGVRVREKLRVGVTEALTELGRGFIAFPDTANDTLREKLDSGELGSTGYFTELLRLIYRFLFLITIEERGLLFEHDITAEMDDSLRASIRRAQEIYRQGYSLRRLRDRSLSYQTANNYSDIWAGLKIVWNALARGESRLDLPSLGGLFGAAVCPNLDPCKISNAAILNAMRKLRWTTEDRRLMLIDYKNLDVEELGSVYESLLELEPVLNVPRGEFSLSDKGGARKTTGSYYTDESLVLSLIKSNLDPLIEEKLGGGKSPPAPAPRSGQYVHACGASTFPSAWSSASPSPKGAAAPLKSPAELEKVLLSITVIDPSCGSGHFLLAAARRLAEHLAQLRHGEITDANYRSALRDIIASCIYGVDLNPLAVELTRMALWLEGYEPGKPLSFLDHHIRCGNSLAGVMDFDVLAKGIPGDAYKALSGDDSEAAKKIKKRNEKEIENIKHGQSSLFADPLEKTAAKLNEFHRRLENAANDSLEDVEKKARIFADLLELPEYRHIKKACDLYTAAFYAEKQNGVPIPTSADVNRAAAGQEELTFNEGVNALAAKIAAENRFFHWPLEFPEVFTKGGFDCVLGNPPW